MNSVATMPITVQQTLQSQLHAQCHTITNRDNAQHNALIMQKLLIQLTQCLGPLVFFLHLHLSAMLTVHCLLYDECTASINGFSQKDVHQVQVLSSAVDCISSLQGRMPAATQRLQPQTDLRVCNLAIPEHIV